jgi:hypothetical protein
MTDTKHGGTNRLSFAKLRWERIKDRLWSTVWDPVFGIPKSIRTWNPEGFSLFFYCRSPMDTSLSNVAMSVLAQITNYSMICGACGLSSQISIHYMYNQLFSFMWYQFRSLRCLKDQVQVLKVLEIRRWSIWLSVLNRKRTQWGSGWGYANEEFKWRILCWNSGGLTKTARGTVIESFCW